MITVAIDEKDKHVLRVTASYLLALAGDIGSEISNEKGEVVAFTSAELAEQASLEPPSPATVFGPQSSTGDLSTAGAGASTIAPEGSAETTFALIPPGVPLPNAATPPAPDVTVAPPTVPHAGGVEVDVRGLPWDARIHSKNRTKLASGEWKLARGVPPERVAVVEQELKGLMSTATPEGSEALPVVTFPDLMKFVAENINASRLSQAQVMDAVGSVGIASLPLLIQRPDLIPSVKQRLDVLMGAPS